MSRVLDTRTYTRLYCNFYARYFLRVENDGRSLLTKRAPTNPKNETIDTAATGIIIHKERNCSFNPGMTKIPHFKMNKEELTNLDN